MDVGVKTSRRKFIATAGVAAGTLMAAGIPRARSEVLAPTPGCSDTHEATPQQTAGPYFKPSSPQRSLLVEPGDAGTQLRVSGRVVTTSCQPLAHALLDIWHADADGRYDLKGFRHRGHLFSDAAGRFELQTILPGLYGGRARHIHVRVQPAGGAMLTTQLYFPNDPANKADSLFDPALLLNVVKSVSPLEATFDFVVRT
jgi:protocatechuate 3,4-dioxygenase beta subunit